MNAQDACNKISGFITWEEIDKFADIMVKSEIDLENTWIVKTPHHIMSQETCSKLLLNRTAPEELYLTAQIGRSVWSEATTPKNGRRPAASPRKHASILTIGRIDHTSLESYEPSAKGMVQSWAEMGGSRAIILGTNDCNALTWKWHTLIAATITTLNVSYELGVTIAYEDHSPDVTLVVTRSMLLFGCTETSITGIPACDGSRGTDFRSCAMKTNRSLGDMSACHASLPEACVASLHTQPEPPGQLLTSESIMNCPTTVAMVDPYRRTIRAEWKIPLLTPLSNNRIMSPCRICLFARPTSDPSGVRRFIPPAVISCPVEILRRE
jgi:hypothetical protein